eukprot:691887-Amphidinium_carterae.1
MLPGAKQATIRPTVGVTPSLRPVAATSLAQKFTFSMLLSLLKARKDCVSSQKVVNGKIRNFLKPQE